MSVYADGLFSNYIIKVFFGHTFILIHSFNKIVSYFLKSNEIYLFVNMSEKVLPCWQDGSFPKLILILTVFDILSVILYG